jgi:hypothetical protein
MSSVEDAKAQVQHAIGRVKEERNKVFAAIGAIVGSRVAVALSGVAAVAFTSHAVFMPGRLPPISKIGLVEAGIAPPAPTADLSDLGVDNAQVSAKVQEGLNAISPYAAQAWHEAVGAAPWLIPSLNNAGAGLAILVLLYTMWLQAKKGPKGSSSLAE